MSKPPLVLDAEQAEAVERMVNEPTRAALNASQYGTGKTVVTVEVGQRVAPDGVKLIVAPLHTKYGWRSTILRQYPDQLVSFVNNKTKAGKQALDDLTRAVPGWYIIGRELFGTVKTTDALAKLGSKIDFLAYDECQRWANHKSTSFARIKKVKPGYRMALSATPAGNKFSGMFAIHQWLWPSLEGHRSYWRWAYQWAKVEEDYFAGAQVVGELEPGAFAASLPCYVRLEKDFGTPLESVIEVVLSPAERKVYDSLERAMIAFIENNPLIVTLPIVQRIRMRQASLGELSFDGETVGFSPDMKSSKFDALLSLIREVPDEPMLILTESAKFATVVATQLIGHGLAAQAWTGEVSENERHEIQRAFEEDDGVDYIVATIPSIGEGVDGLQHRSRFMVWLSRSDNMMLNEQAFRRLFRRGQERQVISLDIVAQDTYDDGQLSTLAERALAMNKSLKVRN